MANQFTTVSRRQRNQTLITFNNGAQWSKISAPTYIDGQQTNCYLVRLLFLILSNFTTGFCIGTFTAFMSDYVVMSQIYSACENIPFEVF